MFYFVKHGKADYSERNTKIYQGFGVNLARLSELGISQAKIVARDKRLKRSNIILSSPYTRALQTAAIISKELGIDIAVETDLHEWLANKNYIYDIDDVAEKAYLEYADLNGEYPKGEERQWENSERIKKRVIEVLKNIAITKK